MFLKTVCFKDEGDFQGTSRTCGGFFTMAGWLHFNCAEVLAVVLCRCVQWKRRKHNGSWYCLRPEPNTNRKPCTHRHVTDSYLILGLKGRTSNGKSYFKFEVSLHHAASPWVFCSSKSSFIVTEDDILCSARRITESEGSRGKVRASPKSQGFILRAP